MYFLWFATALQLKTGRCVYWMTQTSDRKCRINRWGIFTLKQVRFTYEVRIDRLIEGISDLFNEWKRGVHRWKLRILRAKRLIWHTQNINMRILLYIIAIYKPPATIIHRNWRCKCVHIWPMYTFAHLDSRCCLKVLTSAVFMYIWILGSTSDGDLWMAIGSNWNPWGLFKYTPSSQTQRVSRLKWYSTS